MLKTYTSYVLQMVFVCVFYRMFGSAMDLKQNENGEYEVAKGISASIFRAILVSSETGCGFIHCLFVYI